MLLPVKSHISHFYLQHSQLTETGHTERRIIRRVVNRIRSVSSHNTSQTKAFSLDARGQGQSIRTREFSPLPPKTTMRKGPLPPNSVSDGRFIRVSGADISSETRYELENKYSISITPVCINGKEIGYIFGSHTSRDIGQILLLCHGDGRFSDDFTKPADVGLKFVAPPNGRLHILSDELFTKRVAEGNVEYSDPIYKTGNSESVKNYFLGALHPSTYALGNPEKLANHIRYLKDENKPINVMVINSKAEIIRLADVIQGVNDTLHRMPELICGHCRPEDFSVKDVAVKYKYPRSATSRDPAFTPRFEKYKGGYWEAGRSKQAS
ncbi:TPA: hypothetical protein O3H02_004673 [Salmonella enterica subsp. enterica serovar Saintpaul str. CFSAN004144]|nr:hypothetical protein [Salmonella enterica subsp. enterica serovar Saintpaul str. CFSAN004144]